VGANNRKKTERKRPGEHSLWQTGARGGEREKVNTPKGSYEKGGGYYRYRAGFYRKIKDERLRARIISHAKTRNKREIVNCDKYSVGMKRGSRFYSKKKKRKKSWAKQRGESSRNEGDGRFP